MGCVHPEASPNDPGRRSIAAVRQRRAALVAAAAFAVVALGVTTGVTQALDLAALEWFRPDDEWDTTQQRFLPVIDALQPPRAFLLLGLVAALVCVRRRSWRPAVFAGLVAGTSIGATVVMKVLTHRVDPHGDVASTGGSFPSGHVAALIACLGCCVLLCFRRSRWWHWVLVAVPPAAMATALLYTAAHWATDVVGGALLAIAVILWAASWPMRAAVTQPRGAAHAANGEGRNVAFESL